MGFEPLAIGLGHRAIAFGGSIPTGMNRLDRHGGGNAVQFRQHFETTVEKQLQVRLTLVQFTQQAGQADALAFARGLGHQLEAVERIEEQACIALRFKSLGAPERCSRQAVEVRSIT